MIQKTTIYLDEALQCNALWFKSHHLYAEFLLRDQFNQCKAEHAAKAVLQASTPPIISQPVPSNHIHDTDDVNLFPDASESPADNELTSYLGGKHKIPLANAGQALKWWKDHHLDFPILLLMARDYLACSATSASVKRRFSAAADICAEDCGSLAPRTIERCVNS
ncbi:hypothetical protein PCASD_05286 [Puccinia coronata f. sp. avenae]|uniref:HAT C-terminal dimerisation domain-containing protein n=1 Tax=Puccinia coronata f. sp. avenae TaxID=200324 RepID=A0A2N5UY29_9BASI|nr:hypothetical protein PCASD_05286 [Puccinia coronata f. sp. avenae]